MKKLFLLASLLLSLAFGVSLVFSMIFLSGLDQVWVAQAGETSTERAVAVLLPAERDPFWDDLVASLRKEGARIKVVFEVTRYSPSGTNAREMIEKMALSQVDALLCYPPDSIDVADVVNSAESRGLPVLLLENDLPQSLRRVFLGASSFQVGHEVGALIRGIERPFHRVGILLSQSNLARQTIRNSLFLNGLNEGLSGDRRDFLLEEVISPPGRFAGEELVWTLLRRDPPVQILVTTNPKDTSSALQTIVEANRVGKIRLVGVGEDANLRSALEQGMIEGLITRDSGEWAKTVAQTLQSLFAGQTVSSYINLPVHALSKTRSSDGL